MGRNPKSEELYNVYECFEFLLHAPKFRSKRGENTLCNNARHGSFPLHTSQVFLFLFVFMNHQEAFNHLKWDDVGCCVVLMGKETYTHPQTDLSSILWTFLSGHVVTDTLSYRSKPPQIVQDRF